MIAKIQLITRGDDGGSSRSANRALLQAVDEGVLRNVSLMVPGPAFADAAQLFAGRDDICFGLHVTLSSEWNHPKWGPLLASDKVPSLVEPDGSFTTAPNVLHDRGFSTEEALLEVAAQLRIARESGLHISYLDEHMGVSWIGLRESFADLARREGLIDAFPIPSLPNERPPEMGLVEGLIEQLRHTPEGPYVFITHPMWDDEEAQSFCGSVSSPGAVARERDLDRRALIDPRLREFARDFGVHFARYDEIPAEKNPNEHI